MFAAESDEVATHTLAAAAREVLQDVARHREVPFLSLRDRLVRHLQAAGVPDAVKRIHRSQNFFKHADRDPEGTLAFDPERDPSGCYSMPFCCTIGGRAKGTGGASAPLGLDSAHPPGGHATT